MLHSYVYFTNTYLMHLYTYEIILCEHNSRMTVLHVTNINNNSKHDRDIYIINTNELT